MTAKRESLLRIKCCSTSFTSSLLFELGHNGFRLPFGPTLSVESSCKGVDHPNQIVQQIFPIILCEVDDFQSPSLTAQQHFHVAKPKACRPVFVFNDDRGHAL